MAQFLIALAIVMIPLYLYVKLSERWQKRVKTTFWLTVWIYPVLYLVYSSNPGSFGWVLTFLGITLAVTAFSFFWEGGFRAKGSADDDPSGNSNISKNFIDHM